MIPTFCIAPALHSADPARLGEELRAAVAAGADRVLIDGMEQPELPALRIGPTLAQALKRHLRRADGTHVPLDVQLPPHTPGALAAAFAEAGADLVAFHPGPDAPTERTLRLIRAAGCGAGLVFEPAMPLALLEWSLDSVDRVTLFGVAVDLDGTLNRLERTRRLIERSGRQIRLAVDGGFTPAALPRLAAAGADTFVARSGVAGRRDVRELVATLRAHLALPLARAA